MYSINKKKVQNVESYIIYPIAEGLVLASVALFLTTITAYFIYFHALKGIRYEIKEGLLRTVSGIASCIDADQIGSFTSPEQANDENYLKMVKKLQKARLATKHCAYLYVNRMIEDKVYFIIDPPPIDASGTPIYTDELNLEPSVPMKEYQGASPELKKALKEKIPVVAQDYYTDKWGTFYSAYVPLFNSAGNCVGALGADLRIDEMIARLEPMRDATKRAYFVATMLALLMGTLIWFTRRFAVQLNKSRFEIFRKFEESADFATKSSKLIGNFMIKNAMINKKISESIGQAIQKDSVEEQKKLVAEQVSILERYSAKLHQVGQLKTGEVAIKPENFEFSQMLKNTEKLLAADQLEFSRIKLVFDKEIPPKAYGDSDKYAKILYLISSFYLKYFNEKPDLKVFLTSESIDELEVSNTFSIQYEDKDAEFLKSLESVSSDLLPPEKFDVKEFMQALKLPVSRELIYLMTGEFKVSSENNKFVVSFDAILPKYVEDEGIDDDSETKESK
jgi:hypothetical protein